MSWIDRFESLKGQPAWRASGVLAGLAILMLSLLLTPPEGLAPEGQRAAAVTVVMGLWWLGGVLPMAVTAMLPLVAFPMLGVMPVAKAAAPYADPLIFLILGGLILAHGMETVGLHRRLVAWLLAPEWVRRGPRRVALALMVATALVSGFVSNTATMVMMLPIAMGLAAHSATGEAALDKRIRSAMILSTAYACSIGGVATLVGTAPNAVFAGVALSAAGVEVRFIDWMMVGVPFVVLAIPVAWFLVNRVALPLPAGVGVLPEPERPVPHPSERWVVLILVTCFLGWLTRNPVDLGVVEIPGWGPLLPAKVDDGFVAIVGAMALFCLPGRSKAGALTSEDGDEQRFLLSWQSTARALTWSVLLLLGGGFAMAEGITTSGLSTWCAARMGFLETLPGPLAILAICVVVSGLSAFTSNTATTQMVLPLLAAAAVHAGVSPLVWMLPATISASCDFTLAVGTPPNAIAAEAGGITAPDMFRAGILLNLACAVLATGVALTLGAAVFG